MARKRKRKSKKSDKPAALKDGIVNEIVAIAIIVLGLLILIASFGVGGTLPTRLFDGLRYLFGGAAFLISAILLYIGVRVFRSDDHSRRWPIYVGSVLFIVSLAGLLHINASDLASLELARSGNGGGVVGHGTDQFLLQLFNKMTTGIVLFSLLIISILFLVNMPLSEVWEVLKNVLRSDSNDDESSSILKPVSSRQKSEPKLNANVALEQFSKPAKSSVKKEQQASEAPVALTASSDPDWELPDPKLLNQKKEKADAGDYRGNAEIIQQTLADFKIDVDMQDINVGPRVTQYTLSPPSGVRLSKITALEHNIALNLAAQSIRIEAPIPGQRAVGIEVPNKKAALVRLHGILESPGWQKSKSTLSFALGQDISGLSNIGELDRMPHMLIAGATGSGKSVMINSFLCSLLFRNSPADLKLILVDPKRVELGPYNDIPHLLSPVITEPEKCISALKWATAEMERRYGVLDENKKRNISDYNKKNPEEAMPYIVIVIDELADIMMNSARDTEALIVRIAQKARAVGIHLVLATQRPSVDVITGLIKANVPARIAFSVTSQVDSRTIIDGIGAEKLLGSGDMLFSSPDLPKPKRIQAVFISDEEVQAITDHVRMQKAPDYNEDIISQPVSSGSSFGSADTEDSLYNDAVKVVVNSGKASASLLQRRLRVGYARAARLVEAMEEQGVIGPADGSRPRDVLVSSVEDVLGE